MARPKGSKNKTKKEVLDPNIEEIVEEWVEFICPVRGKVRQKVKIKKLKRVTTDQKTFISAKDLVDEIESQEDSISSIEPDPEE